MTNLAYELVEWIQVPENFWVKDFAFQKKFNPARFHDLCQESEDFRKAYQFARHYQEAKIWKLGAAKKLDPTMCIFALKNVAGWRDKIDIDQSGEMKVIIQKESSKGFIGAADIVDTGIATKNRLVEYSAS